MPIVPERDYLEHEGVLERSGRYPWGSGENPYQRLRNPTYATQLAQIDKMHKEKMSDNDIAKAMGISIAQLRHIRTIAREEERNFNKATAIALYEAGWSKTAIGKELGKNESMIRVYLSETDDANKTRVSNIVSGLKEEMETKKFLDIGRGSEQYMGVSRTKFDAAVDAMIADGYVVHNIKINQLTGAKGQQTTIKVLCPPGTEWKDVMKNKGDIQLPGNVVFEDNGMTKLNIHPPETVDPKRVSVRYAEDGGIDMDGVMLIRRGVQDLDLGNSRYAQVRIKVGDGHYLKGMAMYSDDLPEGTDILFNTNKRRGTPMLGEDSEHSVLKPLKSDPDNPFGATINRQSGALNIVNEEGDWSRWSKSLASQFLSKQTDQLVREQLDKTKKQREEEFQELLSLTNPTVKQALLESFADDCDAAAVHLKAAALPGQASKVILPFTDIKDNEIYAPHLEDGTRVVLVRYPHAGRFESPELIVNNKSPTARKTIPNARDAVGINAKVAEQLSGADFDGDTVLVIPNNEGKVKVDKPLAQLADFDPKIQYKAYEGMPKTCKENGFNKPKEMGSVSNLITDMTLKGAPLDEIARAVKHSMVIIDAEKHNLDWRQSAKDNRISELKAKWQGGANKGASTLISQASARADVPETKPFYGINRLNTNPETGERIDQPLTGKTYLDSSGKVKTRMTQTTKMAATKDARTLLSADPNEKELLYADYANYMKAMANRARKAYLDTPNLKYDPQAAKKYAPQVESLNKKLEVAKRNAPLERQAQIYGNLVAAAKIKENNVESYDEKKKIRGQALKAARKRTGAEKQRVTFTDEEWEAIQAGAISHSKLKDILNNANMDSVRSKATPRAVAGLTEAQLSRARTMMDSHKYTAADIAKQLGVTVDQMYNALAQEEDPDYG